MSIPSRKIAGYGWKPDLPDYRDHKFKVNRVLATSLPDSVDLRPKCPGVYDQLDIGSCTANAAGALAQFVMRKNNQTTYVPSRLFIYWNERDIEGDTTNDTGATMRDSIIVLNKLGAPHESLWWYNTKKFAVKPNKNVYADGAKHKIGEYLRLDSTKVTELCNCLAQGFPFIFGFTVYDAFESDEVANTGVLNSPKPSEKVIGGHAVMAVGYDHKTQRFIIRNSWGKDWGMKGYFTIPYDYVTNTDLADDFWTFHTID